MSSKPLTDEERASLKAKIKDVAGQSTPGASEFPAVGDLAYTKTLFTVTGVRGISLGTLVDVEWSNDGGATKQTASFPLAALRPAAK